MRREQILDRYIPKRPDRQAVHEVSQSAAKNSDISTNYSRVLSPDRWKLLRFNSKSVDSTPSQTIADFILNSLKKKCSNSNKCFQTVREAKRILDAPDVIDDFYFNPLDWSSDGSQKVAVALSGDCYLLGPDKQIEEIQRHSSIPISSVKFFRNEPNNFLLLGDCTGRVDLHDLVKNCRVRQMNIHYNRVGVIESLNKPLDPHTFLSGSKDKQIKLNDIRLKRSDVQVFQRHKGEVCGISTQNIYFASGGNDNKVCVWDVRKSCCVAELKHHRSAIKAISWCPWRSCVLATGGGQKDKKIVIWNGNSNTIEKEMMIGSQVSHLAWNRNERTMSSAHYDGRKGYVIIWEAGSKKIKLKGHSGRILGFQNNPINQGEACTLGADETLRFWSVSLQDSEQIIEESKSIAQEKGILNAQQISQLQHENFEDCR